MGLDTQSQPPRGPASRADLDEFDSYLGKGDWAAAANKGRSLNYSDEDIATYAGSTGKVKREEALAYLGANPAKPPPAYDPNGTTLMGGKQVGNKDIALFKQSLESGDYGRAKQIGTAYGFSPDDLATYAGGLGVKGITVDNAKAYLNTTPGFEGVGGYLGVSPATQQMQQKFNITPATNSTGSTLQANNGDQQYRNIMEFVKQTAQKPTAVQVDPRSTVAYQLQQITAQDSPLMQQAKLQGDLGAAQRGLLNSSYTEGARQAEMVKAAMPMAQQDAQTYNAQSGLNQNAADKFQLAGYQAGLDTASKSYLDNTDYLNRSALNTSFTNDSIQQNTAQTQNTKDVNAQQAMLAQQTNALNTYNQYLTANKLQDSTQAFEAWKQTQDERTKIAIQNMSDGAAMQRQIASNENAVKVQEIQGEYKRTGDNQTYQQNLVQLSANIGKNITDTVATISRDPSINVDPVNKYAVIASSISGAVSQLNSIGRLINPNYVPETIWKYMGIDNNPDMIGKVLSNTPIASSINGDLIKLPPADKIAK